MVHKMETQVSRLNRLCDTRLLKLDQSKEVIEFETEIPKVMLLFMIMGAVCLLLPVGTAVA